MAPARPKSSPPEGLIRYRFRLEGTGAFEGEFREGSIVSLSEQEARFALTSQEMKACRYELPAKDIKELHAKRERDRKALKADPEAERSMTPSERLRLRLHEQAEPYELVSLEAAPSSTLHKRGR